MSEKLTRPIIGIENRTAQEVFDMMCDRIRRTPAPEGEAVAWRQLAEAIYRQVVPLLEECSEPNPEDYINAILAALGTKGADHD